MSRTFRTALAGAAAGLALALAATAPAASAPKMLQGSVGPGFTIKLTLAGKKVTKLKKGVPYRFQIRDRSPIHDFHLMGPGVNRVLTGVDFTGQERRAQAAEGHLPLRLRPARLLYAWELPRRVTADRRARLLTGALSRCAQAVRATIARGGEQTG